MADSHEYIASLDDVKIGKNVLESLTRSAYDDCRCILREYVQNAADQIDIAREQNLSEGNSYGVYINIYPETRRIEIEDNATGVEASEVLPVLRNVACSNKKRGKQKGFRGIGRLGGLGYCSTLTFITSFKGEDVRSVLKWNADEMSRIIDDESDESSASDVVSRVTSHSTEKEKPDLHYFKIIMEDVSDRRLLDAGNIRDYLSMVAPVDIANTFKPFKDEIKRFMKENNLVVDTYDVYVNGEQIYKPYTRSIYDENGAEIDKIYKVVPFIRNDSLGNPFYWGWYGVSKLEGMLKFKNLARGIRLRCKNIQLGDEGNCRRFLPGKQDQRFSDYFFGEIHTLSELLIPDMDRNYLRVDDARTEFEALARKDFATLKNLCYEASGYKSDYKKILTAQEKGKKLEEKKKNKEFASKEELAQAQEEFEKSKKLAESAEKSIAKRKQNLQTENSPLAGVIDTSYDPTPISPSAVVSGFGPKPEEKPSEIKDSAGDEEDGCLRTSKPIYKRFNKSTLAVINAVYKVIGDVLPMENMREALISKIEAEITK